MSMDCDGLISIHLPSSCAPCEIDVLLQVIAQRWRACWVIELKGVVVDVESAAPTAGAEHGRALRKNLNYPRHSMYMVHLPSVTP